MQVHSIPESDSACLRARKALRLLVEARRSQHLEGHEEACRTLEDALRSTLFGQSFDVALIGRLLPFADCINLQQDEVLELHGYGDALYVLLDGRAEIIQGPAEKALTISVQSVSGLSETASGIDASEQEQPGRYVVVRLGMRQYSTPIASGTGFNWSVTVSYLGESEVEFILMEVAKDSDNARGSGRPTMTLDEPLGFAVLRADQFVGGFAGALKLSPPHSTVEQVSLQSSAAGGKASSLHVRMAWTEGAAASPLAQDLSPAMAARATCVASRGAEIELPRSMTRQQSEPVRPSEAMAASFGTTADGAATALGLGEFCDMGQPGGAIRCLDDAELLMVPRACVIDAMAQVREEHRSAREECLRRWFPGMQTLDARAFDGFAASFKEAVFPRGHVFCGAGGDQAASSRRVYLIRQGTCRISVPNQPPRPAPPGGSGKGSPVWRKSSASLSPQGTPVGLLGEGALIGYASALFSLPEPFVAVADGPVSVLFVDMADRPSSSWPREVVNRLHELLKERTDWHSRRADRLAAAFAMTDKLTADVERGSTPWTPARSPFLKHKELQPWRAQTLKDLYQEGAFSLDRGLQMEPASDPKPGSVFGPCSTPWGTWTPSGMITNVQPSEGRLAWTKARERKTLPAVDGTRPKPRSSTLSPLSKEERGRPPLNLRCGSDWKTISSMASTGALEKMVSRHELRKGHVFAGQRRAPCRNASDTTPRRMSFVA